MIQSAKLVQPALEEFYASLSNEQKARFNTLGTVAVPLDPSPAKTKRAAARPPFFY